MPASSDSRLPTNSHPDADYSMPSVKRANLAAYKARKALYQVVIEGDYELGDQLVEENGNKATGIFGTSTQLADWLSYEDDMGLTVLHVAAGTGSVDGVKWLLKNGADKNQVSSATGMSAIDYARHQNEQGTLKVLQEWDAEAGAELLNKTSGRAIKKDGNCTVM